MPYAQAERVNSPVSLGFERNVSRITYERSVAPVRVAQPLLGEWEHMPTLRGSPIALGQGLSLSLRASLRSHWFAASSANICCTSPCRNESKKRMLSECLEVVGTDLVTKHTKTLSTQRIPNGQPCPEVAL